MSRKGFRKTGRRQSRGTSTGLQAGHVTNNPRTERNKMTSNVPRHATTGAAQTTTPQTVQARPGRTPAQINAEQKAMAERGRQPARSTAITTGPAAAVPAVSDTKTAVQGYLDEIAPASIVGRMVKFGKGGNFTTTDDGATLDEDIIYAAHCDQTLIGYVKFNGQGEPPDRHMGLLYGDFHMPPRETLGDTDPAKWELGLSGQPQDPYQHHVYLVLEHAETHEMFTFVTSSQTGRRAIGNLLKHFDRVQKTDAGHYPLVKLRTGGFNHRDERVGWVPVPVVTVVGRIPRVDVAQPTGGKANELNDDLPFDL